jgi:hypothetical protein
MIAFVLNDVCLATDNAIILPKWTATNGFDSLETTKLLFRSGKVAVLHVNGAVAWIWCFLLVVIAVWRS